MQKRLPFVGATQDGRVNRFQGQRLINWAPQIEKSGARSRLSLMPDPGCRLLATIGDGPHRAPMINWKGKLYGISGSKLFSSTAGGATLNHGSIGSSQGRVVMAGGRNQLVMVDGQNGYVWDGMSIATITDGSFFAGSTHVAYLDGFFIFHKDNQYQISALEDATSISSLDFRSAEGDSDDIAAVVANAQDLYLIGTRTTEVHYNSGSSENVPFRPYNNNVIRWGTIAPYSVSEGPPGVVFVAQTDAGGSAVVLINGLQAQVISDVDIEWQIESMTTVQDAYGWIYQQAGRWWYQLTFPSERRTFVYGFESKLWHERQTYGKGRHRAASHGFIGGTHIVGDFETGSLYELSMSTYLDGSLPIIRDRYTPTMHANGDVLTFDEVTLLFNTGSALLESASPTEGDGSDPYVRMRYADNGEEFGPWMEEPLGKIGNTHRRAVFSALGDSIERQFHIRVSAPILSAMADAYAEVTVESF